MAEWIPDTTPILESVFVSVADYADDIAGIFDQYDAETSPKIFYGQIAGETR